MHKPPRDTVLFFLCAASTVALAATVVFAAAIALRIGAFDHAQGLLLNMCTAALQFAGGVTAITLLALPVLLVGSGLVRATLIARRARRHARRMLAGRQNLPERLVAAAQQAAIAGRVDLVRATSAEAFVHGLLRPRMMVTTGALELLDEGELAAVVHHEAHHINRRDPLRLVFADAAARSLFMFPLVHQLARQVMTVTELAADRRAIQRADVLDLASALTKFLRSPQVAAAPGVALEPASDERLAQLLDPDDYAHRVQIRRGSVIATVATLCALMLTVALLGALPAMHPA